MPHKQPPGSAHDWLLHAKSDMALAEISLPSGVLFEDLCFHAQQAAEKAVKAVLLSCGREFSKTHNIRVLLDALPSEITVPDDVNTAAGLTDYAVISRYPGDAEAVDEAEYKEAVRLAEAVMHWAESIITA